MSNAHLAALLGNDSQQEDFAHGGGSQYPSIYFRSGNVQAADLAPDSLHHSGFWFIKEDAIPAGPDGSQATLEGFEVFSYLNAKNERVHGQAIRELTFQVIGMRRCHMCEDNGARLPWDDGWANDAYAQGYTQKSLQVMINIKGVDTTTPFVIPVSNRQQMAFTGHKNVEGVVPAFKRVIAPKIAEEAGLPKGSVLPLRCYWMTVGVKYDESGEIEFTTVPYKDEHGEEQQSAAKTGFALVEQVSPADALASAEEIAAAATQRDETEEWRTEWDSAHGSVSVAAVEEESVPEEAAALGM